MTIISCMYISQFILEIGRLKFKIIKTAFIWSNFFFHFISFGREVGMNLSKLQEILKDRVVWLCSPCDHKELDLVTEQQQG